jgi:hypothetical protein
MENPLNRLKLYDRVSSIKRAYRVQLYQRNRRKWAVLVGGTVSQQTDEMSNGQRFVCNIITDFSIMKHLTKLPSERNLSTVINVPLSRQYPLSWGSKR